MLTPAFETFVTAMMCLCPNKDNITSSMNYGVNSESVVFHTNEVTHVINKIDALEKSFAEVHTMQKRILNQLNVNPIAYTPVGEGNLAACASSRQIINIEIPTYHQAFQVLCNGDIDGFGNSWLVVQQRYDGSVNFFRQWSEYVNGFGILQGEFFIGLEKLHALTMARTQELIIIMEDFERDRRFAHYDQFQIGSANESYALKILGKYFGNAGDSLSRHVTHKFSTYDRDNDIYNGNCAVEYSGAWWYDECEMSNLNGQYLSGMLSPDKFGKGMSWSTYHGLDYSLKIVKMMIRPKQ